MVSYKELGLSNTKRMFEVALERKFAVPGYNFSNLEQLQAIIMGCGETNSPVILQNSPAAGAYANPAMVRYLGEGAVAMARDPRRPATHHGGQDIHAISRAHGTRWAPRTRWRGRPGGTTRRG